jgi:hypothetical protein
MPKPKPSETQAEFIERCIPIVLEEGTADDANQAYAVCLSMWENEKKFVKIQKKDAKNQVVKGIVYSPGYIDTDGETMDSATVAKAAWDFLATRKEKNIDINHNWKESGCHVVESYVAEKGDPNFPEGSWVIAVKCTDDIWEKVEKGELNGFSFGGTVTKYPQRVLLEVSKQIIGETYENMNKDIIPPHTHNFTILYDSEGKIVKGETDFSQEHNHTISYGTATDSAVAHSHRIDLNEDE